ncbi:MAG: type II secretion system F family protein [Candidatus Omnitrophica bacterium]|nr:type II secretion system F family protein [Candidatus Omnitrophota bacterium]
MPQFSYKAKAGPQNITTGFIEANSASEAVTKLINAGKTPIDVKLSTISTGSTLTKSKIPNISIPRMALYQWTRQLADLQDAGVPLARSMQLLGHQRQFPEMIKIIEAIKMVLQQGGSLSAALTAYPHVFPSMYVNTIKAAEASGKMPLVLNRLAQFLEVDMIQESKVKSSLLYPAIILIVGFLTIFVLLSFVLPRVTLMFEDFDTQLPLLTQIIISVSQIFAQFWWLMALSVAGAIVWMRWWIKTNNGKAQMDAFLLKVPLLKTFIQNTQLSRFARTLAMLLESGVPIVNALESVVLVVDNKALQQEVYKMTDRIKSGMGLAEAVKQSPLFPEMTVDLIAVGQEAGKLEKGLYKLADYSERLSQDMAQTFTTILGPAVLVLVVGIVGFMIVAMLLPMFQMNMIIK